MPKREDIHSILIIGAGPIVIGQACEFDYSGTQACKALRAEGYRTILVNSNPATIMTDPDMADVTYIEPLTIEILEKIIAKERPDAVLPTVGGQTALNLAVDLEESGILAKYGVISIGAPLESILIAEDRQKFREAMEEIGLPVPPSGVAHTLEEALALIDEVGLPALIRPSRTLGGSGGGIVYTMEDFERVVAHGLRESPNTEVLVEQSILGWKEYELEVMRDRANNFVVVCSIENVDPMGIHTGDSITVAPSQTLTDREYQRLRDMAGKVMEIVGVETGGSNVQFAVNPENGDVIVIEMNPRVSRSSALASKATGFPIAKIAALLAVGYTLDEIPNDITKETPASFEPSIDYCVVKVPRWNFEKFPGSDHSLGPQMKSVGEVMAIGRTFQESFNKAIRGLEVGLNGFGKALLEASETTLPTATKLYQVCEARLDGTPEPDHNFDPWWVQQCIELVELERELSGLNLADVSAEMMRDLKRKGFGDNLIANSVKDAESINALEVRAQRLAANVRPVYHKVDTCAAEFAAQTPYLYSTYEVEDESDTTDRQKIMILGGGPNRIGQGIEFDYCCVQACFKLKDAGYETIMVNCNPETVSTDYDTADRLYFEPLTLEDVLNIVDLEKPMGVIVQFGGQTPIRLAQGLAKQGVPILGTQADSIDLAEDRIRFGALLEELGISSPKWGTATNIEDAKKIAAGIGYPVLVRPSYVLGGRAMEIAHSESALEKFWGAALEAATDAELDITPTVLIDQFLENAIEVDVDAIGDGDRIVVGGIMQHIEEAGVHSGDSACVLPPYKVTPYQIDLIKQNTEKLGNALSVHGLMNVQYAIKDDDVYVIEVNPRASRTVPYVSKAIGTGLAGIAARVMAGEKLVDLGLTQTPSLDGFFVKEAVLPFKKFPGSDALLGPEMRSTGEVMGHASRFGAAFAKSQSAAGTPLPTEGVALLTVTDSDKAAILPIARDLDALGFTLRATRGTAAWLRENGLVVETANKIQEGGHHIAEMVDQGELALIVNTPLGQGAYDDNRAMRMRAVLHNTPMMTTLSAARAAVEGIKALKARDLKVRSLQTHHAN